MELYDISGGHPFSENHCFLCGDPFAKDGGSQEHVFPKWLQHRFDLWDQTLTLLNGTTIPYRQLKIPCCATCNNKHLSQLEDRVQAALFSKLAPQLEAAKRDIHLWTMKLFFGVLYREVLLPLDRSRRALGSIVERDDMRRGLRMMHFFLQSVRVPMQFHSLHTPLPASIFIFDLKEPITPKLRFDFRDDVVHMCAFLRLGTKGILAAFDTGAQEAVCGDLMNKFLDETLHPIQFEELGAKLFYKASLLNRLPFFVITQSGDGCYHVLLLEMDNPDALSRAQAFGLPDGRVVVQAVPPKGAKKGPFFKKWKQKQYAKFVSHFTRFPLEHVNPRSQYVMSWLSDDKGQFVNMSLFE